MSFLPTAKVWIGGVLQWSSSRTWRHPPGTVTINTDAGLNVISGKPLITQQSPRRQMQYEILIWIPKESSKKDIYTMWKSHFYVWSSNEIGKQRKRKKVILIFPSARNSKGREFQLPHYHIASQVCNLKQSFVDEWMVCAPSFLLASPIIDTRGKDLWCGQVFRNSSAWAMPCPRYVLGTDIFPPYASVKGFADPARLPAPQGLPRSLHVQKAMS